MEVIYPRCAGLDVHKQTVVACVRLAREGPPLQEVRKQFVRERSSHVQRIEKILEDANLKLSVVISDLLGQSGRAVLEAIVAGQSEPAELLAHVSIRVKASRAELLEALRGRISMHHRFMLKLHLAHIDALDKAVAEIEREVGHGLEPFRQAAKLPSTMPGLSAVSANVIVAEIGIDMSRFQSAGHLLSWACLCPRNDESAGKRRSTRLRRGGKWLKATLVQATWASRAGQGLLSASAVPSHPCAPWREESHHRGGLLHAHRRVAHAARWHRVERPGGRTL